MNLTAELTARVDEDGRLVFPPEVASRHGFEAGVQVRLDEDGCGLILRRPVTQLAKVYVEATNACNLACRMCVRGVWDEPTGQMSAATFTRIIEGLRCFSPPPDVFFGGYGEPLAHPHIVDMVAQAKATGASVELITNGTLLSRDLSRRLIAAGLDGLWVSLDGARAESYADVRLGAALPEVLSNIRAFRDSRRILHPPRPQLGIAFVAMKRNISDLPAVLHLGRRLGATRFLVTNLLPHTDEMRGEILYQRALNSITFLPSIWVPHLDLPKMDVDQTTREALYSVLHGGRHVKLVDADLGSANDRCPFIEKGAVAISWDGSFSPCLPLLYSHVSYLKRRKRFSRRYILGSVAERDLLDLWHAPEHTAFRQRVQDFRFSPCTACGGCELSLTNEADCYANAFPTCGGCLWAQGVIRCP